MKVVYDKSCMRKSKAPAGIIVVVLARPGVMIPHTLLPLRFALRFFRRVQSLEIRIERSHFERNLFSLRQ